MKLAKVISTNLGSIYKGNKVKAIFNNEICNTYKQKPVSEDITKALGTKCSILPEKVYHINVYKKFNITE